MDVNTSACASCVEVEKGHSAYNAQSDIRTSTMEPNHICWMDNVVDYIRACACITNCNISANMMELDRVEGAADMMDPNHIQCLLKK